MAEISFRKRPSKLSAWSQIVLYSYLCTGGYCLNHQRDPSPTERYQLMADLSAIAYHKPDERFRKYPDPKNQGISYHESSMRAQMTNDVGRYRRVWLWKV